MHAIFYQVSDPVAGAGERTEDKKKISVMKGVALGFSNTKSNFITYLGPGSGQIDMALYRFQTL